VVKCYIKANYNKFKGCSEMYSKTDFESLINLIETEEKVRVSFTNNPNNISIVGNNKVNLPNISFRIENNTFILPNIYLLNERKGLGTKIFEWIIDFCKKNGIRRFEVRIVDYKNINMRSLGKKFKMHEVENIERLNLVLKLND
jgi:hypothetical protein